MAGGGERRKNARVVFERGIEVYLMAIDGTWRHDCVMQDVCENGAKLTVRGSIEGLCVCLEQADTVDASINLPITAKDKERSGTE